MEIKSASSEERIYISLVLERLIKTSWVPVYAAFQLFYYHLRTMNDDDVDEERKVLCAGSMYVCMVWYGLRIVGLTFNRHFLEYVYCESFLCVLWPRKEKPVSETRPRTKRRKKSFE